MSDKIKIKVDLLCKMPIEVAREGRQHIMSYPAIALREDDFDVETLGDIIIKFNEQTQHPLEEYKNADITARNWLSDFCVGLSSLAELGPDQKVEIWLVESPPAKILVERNNEKAYVTLQDWQGKKKVVATVSYVSLLEEAITTIDEFSKQLLLINESMHKYPKVIKLIEKKQKLKQILGRLKSA